MQQVNQPRVFTTSRCYNSESTNKMLKQLHLNTHTKEWMFPPIMKTIAKNCLFRFQPQEGIQFNLFSYNIRIKNSILEYTVISFLPNSPDIRKPNNSQERMSDSRQASHIRKLNEMMSNIT